MLTKQRGFKEKLLPLLKEPCLEKQTVQNICVILLINIYYYESLYYYCKQIK